MLLFLRLCAEYMCGSHVVIFPFLSHYSLIVTESVSNRFIQLLIECSDPQALLISFMNSNVRHDNSISLEAQGFHFAAFSSSIFLRAALNFGKQPDSMRVIHILKKSPVN